MKTYNELKLAKELIRFPTITPVDAGIMKYLSKKLLKYLDMDPINLAPWDPMGALAQ